ncbi:MAG: glycosyltransferase family 2 protein [Rhodobacteraceae bacterium]|nr:glycosyltransferase family 2 protein [Paracoccaceae bacterium]
MIDAPTPRWGLVSTIKAPARDILRFAGHHLEAGAHRLYLFLDAPNDEVYPHLKAHPKIRVQVCDDAFWQRHGTARPEKHQPRQTMNASRTYRRKAEMDWLIHIDVDEFLWSENPIADQLGVLGKETLCARVRPIESLANSKITEGMAFKACPPSPSERDSIVERVYPHFGQFVKGGFLSHIQGKVFVRTGLKGVQIKIHNVFKDGVENPSQAELPEVDLCHVHARDWDDWLAHYRFRLKQGSYRAELKPARARHLGGVNLNEFFSLLEAEEGLEGLRRFHDEVCADTPDLRAKLQSEGLLRIRDLQLDQKLRKHFPKF